MKKMKILGMVILIAALSGKTLYAQGGTLLDFGGEFLLSLVAGIILAFGFQALLSLLSVAAGISVAGPFNKKSTGSGSDNSGSDSSGSTGVKISSGLGAWTLITVSISLFFATLLSMKLILVDSNMLAMVLGLVIWAAFFTTMMILEMKSISTLAGGLFSLATSALSNSFSAIKSTFEKDQQKAMQETIDHSIEKVREEMNSQIDSSDITAKLDEYVEKLKPETLDYDRIEEELKQIINEIEVEHKSELDEDGLNEKIFINIAEKQPNLDKEDVKKVGELFNKIKSASKEGSSRTDKVAAGVDKIMPGSEEDTARMRQRIADYLRKTDAEEIKPQKLEEDLEKILNDPKSSKEVLLNRINKIDKQTLIDLLKGSEKIDDNRARTIVNKAEQAFNNLKSRTQSTGSQAASAKEKAASVTDEKQKQVQQMAAGKKITYEMKLRTFFNNMKRPEFNYERIKLDLIRIFKNPRQSPEILKRRLKEYDRDSLITLMSQRKGMSRADAENFVQKFEDARDKAIEKIEELESQVVQKAEQLKQSTLNQLEAARKTAVAAAWWLVGTAIVSGGAAILGGILAIT